MLITVSLLNILPVRSIKFLALILLLFFYIHKNILPIEYGKSVDGKELVGTVHSHLPETGEFITATDVCTLMLYGKFANWKTHNVVSKEYLNIWNCETNTLTVIPLNTLEKINKDQEKRNQKKKKE